MATRSTSFDCMELEVKPCPMMIVSKAPVLAPSRKKPLSTSQEVLFTLLNKRFQRYLLSTQTKTNGNKNDKIDIQECSPVKATDNQTSSVKMINENTVTVSKHTNAHTRLGYRPSDRTASNTLEEMECQELAEHVINQAKVKLRRRSKARRNLFKDDCSKKGTISSKKVVSEGMCNTKPFHDHRKLPSPYSTSTLKTNQSPVKRCKESNFPLIPQSPPSLVQSPSKTPSLVQSPSKTPSLVQSPSKTPSLVQSPSKTPSLVQSPSKTPSLVQSPSKTPSLVQSPSKTVYLSEMHSITPKQTGIPNAPPTSPDSLFARSHNYVQSLCDTKSQRRLRSQLQDLFDLCCRQEAAAHRENQLAEKRKEKEDIIRLKARQRAEIYALNGLMKKFEEEKFREFISGRV